MRAEQAAKAQVLEAGVHETEYPAKAVALENVTEHGDPHTRRQARRTRAKIAHLCVAADAAGIREARTSDLRAAAATSVTNAINALQATAAPAARTRAAMCGGGDGSLCHLMCRSGDRDTLRAQFSNDFASAKKKEKNTDPTN